jgi:hypothetical protein
MVGLARMVLAMITSVMALYCQRRDCATGAADVALRPGMRNRMRTMRKM